MKYKILFFDCDGVVVENTMLFSDMLKRDYGIAAEVMQPFFLGPYRDCSIGKKDLKEELQKVVDDWGWQGSVEALMKFWFTKGTELNTQAIKYIEELNSQGVACFMTTDQEKYRGESLRTKLVNGKLFKKIFFSAEIGFKKKQKEFWQYVMDNLEHDISPSEILVIDDDQRSLDSAASFGMSTHLFTSLTDLKEVVS